MLVVTITFILQWASLLLFLSQVNKHKRQKESRLWVQSIRTYWKKLRTNTLMHPNEQQQSWNINSSTLSKQFEFPWISIQVSGNKLKETESGLTAQRETAERGKISAQGDSPPRLAALPTPLSRARLSGCQVQVALKSAWQPEPTVMGSSAAHVSLSLRRLLAQAERGVRAESNFTSNYTVKPYQLSAKIAGRTVGGTDRGSVGWSNLWLKVIRVYPSFFDIIKRDSICRSHIQLRSVISCWAGSQKSDSLYWQPQK